MGRNIDKRIMAARRMVFKYLALRVFSSSPAKTGGEINLRIEAHILLILEFLAVFILQLNDNFRVADYQSQLFDGLLEN